jgi:hypothetical protein
MNDPTELQLRHEAGCLIATPAGHWLLEHKEEAIKAVAEAVKARPVRAVLVDLRGLTAGLTFMDRYQLGSLAGRYLAGIPLGTLMEPSQIDPSGLGKLVAANRGVNLEIFTDLEEATRWLRRYQTGAPPAIPGEPPPAT